MGHKSHTAPPTKMARIYHFRRYHGTTTENKRIDGTTGDKRADGVLVVRGRLARPSIAGTDMLERMQAGFAPLETAQRTNQTNSTLDLQEWI